MSSLITTSFTEATRNRRSLRALEPRSPVPDNDIIQLANAAILTVPSAFDSQTTRLTLLFGNDHKKLWSITGDALLAKIGQARWEGGPRDKINAFANAYGTILVWDDERAAADMKENAPDIYKDKTDEWVQQSSGMHQYYLWVALEALGLGVNVQHYNPLIDDGVAKEWRVPATWRLKAQMVFGTPKDGSSPGPKKQKLPVEQRVQVFGATKL